MVLEEISDETSYSISDRKFFTQSVTVKLMAYIIEPEDFEVKKYPKRINTMMEGDVFKKNEACVEIEEFENPMKNKTITVNITLESYHTKVNFVFDTEMVVEHIVTENVRNIKMMVNDDLYYTNKTFKLHNEDDIRIQIIALDVDKPSKIQLVGYDPNSSYLSTEVAEKVFEEPITNEIINIE
jgi:hypothetical protein